MNFKKSKNEFNIRLAPLYGDSDILLSIYHSKFWEQIFKKDKSATFLFFRELVRLTIEMFAYSIRVFLRIKYGKRTTGIILTIATVYMIIAFNSVHFGVYLSPIALYLAPFKYFFIDVSNPSKLILEEIHSQNLLGFLYAFLFWSFCQLFTMYLLGWTNKKDTTKRGDSLIYLLLKNHLDIQESTIQSLVEPILVGVIAILFLKINEDFTFFLFLSTASISLMIQEQLDSAQNDILKSDS
ncbi:MAG: hypothetical protein P1U70_06185 [Saprospiraceae bacterium]|jgi:hypothetical protein|nr:hypothetical protein [Saprospiraceae bacterium]